MNADARRYRFLIVAAARRAACCNPSSKLCELRGSVRDQDCSADGAARTRRCASLRQRGTRPAAASTTGAAAQQQRHHMILSQRHGAHGGQHGRFCTVGAARRAAGCNLSSKLCELRGSVRDQDCSGGAARTRRCASLQQRGTRRANSHTARFSDAAAASSLTEARSTRRAVRQVCTVGAARRAACCNPSSKLCELRGSVRDQDCSADGAARTRRCASLQQRGTQRAAASTTDTAAQRQQMILSQRHGAHGGQYGRFAL
jgi:hypothetical protein